MHAVKRHALLRSQFAPTFATVLAFEGSWSFIIPQYGYDHPLGVAHADDLQYLFNSTEFPLFTTQSKEYRFSRRLVNMWSTFAHTGYGNSLP
jgi:carboxylesterase type B